jgi:hypothetical protein
MSESQGSGHSAGGEGLIQNYSAKEFFHVPLALQPRRSTSSSKPFKDTVLVNSLLKHRQEDEHCRSGESLAEAFRERRGDLARRLEQEVQHFGRRGEETRKAPPVEPARKQKKDVPVIIVENSRPPAELYHDWLEAASPASQQHLPSQQRKKSAARERSREEQRKAERKYLIEKSKNFDRMNRRRQKAF